MNYFVKNNLKDRQIEYDALSGTISASHVKDSGDLVKKLRWKNMTDKLMASPDLNPFVTGNTKTSSITLCIFLHSFKKWQIKLFQYESL